MSKKRLTVGYRARILTISENLSINGKDSNYSNESSQRLEFGGREVLLHERSSNGDFSVMLIGEGITELEKKDPNTIVDQMAWVSESDMELVNMDLDTNLNFMDWYEENKDNFCPDCGAWFPNRGCWKPATEEDYECPKCGHHE